MSHSFFCLQTPLHSLTLIFFFREGEALRVLADLHGGGDRTNEWFNTMKSKRQVAICITCKFFNYSFLFSVGFLRARSKREILYGLVETGKSSSRHALNVLANVVPAL